MGNLKLLVFSALTPFVWGMSHNAYGMENILPENEIPRIRCLWNLGSEVQAAALGILEKKISQEAFQGDYKLRTTYIKKLGEFLNANPQYHNANPRYRLELEILKADGQNLPKIENFYNSTLNNIEKSSLTPQEKIFQTIKVKTFYSHIPIEITKLSPEEHFTRCEEATSLNRFLETELSFVECDLPYSEAYKLRYLEYLRDSHKLYTKSVSVERQPRQFINGYYLYLMLEDNLPEILTPKYAPAIVKLNGGQYDFIVKSGDDVKRIKLPEGMETTSFESTFQKYATDGCYLYFMSERRYGLHLMSELPTDGKPLKNKIYIQKNGNKLKYKVISPVNNNQTVDGVLDIKVDEDLTSEILDSLKGQILDKTLKKGDILPESGEEKITAERTPALKKQQDNKYVLFVREKDDSVAQVDPKDRGISIQELGGISIQELEEDSDFLPERIYLEEGNLLLQEIISKGGHTPKVKMFMPLDNPIIKDMASIGGHTFIDGDVIKQAQPMPPIQTMLESKDLYGKLYRELSEIEEIADEIKKAAEQPKYLNQAESLKRLAAKLYFKVGKSLPSDETGLECKLSCYEKSSTLGYTWATYHLAELLNTKKGQGKESTYQYYVDSAQNNNPLSLYKMAKILEKGDEEIDIAPNKEEAQNYHEKAARQGHPYSQYKLAMRFMEGPREAEGMELLQKSAESGYFKAQSRLAKKHEERNKIAIKNPELSHKSEEGGDNVKTGKPQATKETEAKETGQPAQMENPTTAKTIASLEAKKTEGTGQAKETGEQVKEAREQAQTAVLEKTNIEKQANEVIKGMQFLQKSAEPGYLKAQPYLAQKHGEGNKTTPEIPEFSHKPEEGGENVKTGKPPATKQTGAKETGQPTQMEKPTTAKTIASLEAEKTEGAGQAKETGEQVKEAREQAQTAVLEKTNIGKQANEVIRGLNEEVADLNKQPQKDQKPTEAENVSAATQDKKIKELEKQVKEAQKQAQTEALEKTKVEERATRDKVALNKQIQEAQKQAEAEKVRAARLERKIGKLEKRIEEDQKQAQAARLEKIKVEEQANDVIANLNKHIQEAQKQAEAKKDRAGRQDKKMQELEQRIEEVQKQAQAAVLERIKIEKKANQEIADLNKHIRDVEKQTKIEKSAVVTPDKKMQESGRQVEEGQRQAQTTAREKIKVEEKADRGIAGLNKHSQRVQKQEGAEKTQVATQDKKIRELERLIEEIEKKGASEKGKAQDRANKLAAAKQTIGLLKKQLATQQKDLKVSPQKLIELPKDRQEKENKEAAGHGRKVAVEQRVRKLDVILEAYKGGRKTLAVKGISRRVNRYGSHQTNNTNGGKILL